MKKQIKSVKDWPEHLQNHRQNCELVFEDLATLKQELQDGRDTKLSLQHLKEGLLRIRQEAEWLHGALTTEPIQRIFSPDRANLTEQQYYLLRAAGIMLPPATSLRISPVDDYEVYRYCIYEDDKRVCFVHPDENPVVETVDEKTGYTKIRIRLAISPEEIELKHLRPEQREFFAKYRPDVLERIQKD